MKTRFANLILLFCSFVISFLIAEGGLRYLGHYDEDGNFFFKGKQLGHHRLPVKRARAKIEAYLSSTTSSTMYDPRLGWTHRPTSESENHLYKYNADGIRTKTPYDEITKIPESGTLRIALFGDSFIRSDEVPFEDSLGYYLEQALQQAGIRTEVLNFGVGGYGMDQAYLRWLYQGREFNPHIVIFGFTFENINRNVNLIRPVLFPEAGIPFSKPRFLLKDSALKLINTPTPAPRELLKILKNICSWDLASHEWWLPSDYCQERWGGNWHFSFMSDFFFQGLSKPRYRYEKFYSPEKGAFPLSLEIVRAFKESVETHGAEFYVVFLPSKTYLSALSQEKKPRDEDLLRALNKFTKFINPDRHLLNKVKILGVDSLFLAIHYTPIANKIIAYTMSQYLVKDLKNIDRFQSKEELPPANPGIPMP